MCEHVLCGVRLLRPLWAVAVRVFAHCSQTDTGAKRTPLQKQLIASPAPALKCQLQHSTRTKPQPHLTRTGWQGAVLASTCNFVCAPPFGLGCSTPNPPKLSMMRCRNMVLPSAGSPTSKLKQSAALFGAHVHVCTLDTCQAAHPLRATTLCTEGHHPLHQGGTACN